MPLNLSNWTVKHPWVLSIFIFYNNFRVLLIHLTPLHYLKSIHIRIFSGPLSSAFGLNTERYSVYIRIQPECGRIQTRKTPKTDAFHAVFVLTLHYKRWKKNNGSSDINLGSLEKFLKINNKEHSGSSVEYNNRASFSLWWKENLLKHQRVSKCYDNDCLQNFLSLFMSLLPAKLVKHSHI